MNADDETDRTDAREADAKLLRRAGAGDGHAFHELIDRHADRLYRTAVSLVGNAADAEDVLQDAFAGAFRGAAKFEGRSSVRSWLTQIVVTQAARFWRLRKGRRDLSLDADVDRPSSADESRAVDARLDLNAALQRLSQEHREVLVLREIEGMAYEQMAEVLGVPRGTIESRLFRARAELKRHLTAYKPE